jgi:hypothetical protein
MTCDHDARRRDGRFVCLKCKAEYRFEIGGARWVGKVKNITARAA